MKIDIRGQRRHLSPELREFATRKTQFSLGRFAASIQQLELHVSDQNGPKGGTDKTCKLLLKHVHGAPLVVSMTAEDAFVAVAESLEKAGRTFRRLHDRILGRRRRASPLFGWDNIDKP